MENKKCLPLKCRVIVAVALDVRVSRNPEIGDGLHPCNGVYKWFHKYLHVISRQAIMTKARKMWTL